MWRTRIARSVAIAMVASALTGGACSSGTAPAGELEAAKSRWERSAPGSYTVTIARSCECLPEMTGPVVVTVRNGVVDSRQYVRSGAAVTTSYVSLFPGVDGLFAIIEDAIQNGTRRLVARYHPTLGYPTRIELGDPAVDAPVYVVSDLEPQ